MQITNTKIIDAPADAVWDLMGAQFGDVANWSDMILKSSVSGPVAVGVIRTCDLKPTPAASGTIKERLTKFDPGRKALSYDVFDGLPGFMRRVSSNWTFEPVGEHRTRVTNVMTVKVAWYMTPMLPMIKMQFGKTIRALMGEIETAAAPGIRVVEAGALAG